MKRTGQIISVGLMAIFSLMFLSCEEMLESEQEGVLSYEDNYKNEFDSRSAAMGIAGLFQQTLPEQYVLLGELRADLMDVTENADEYMRQLSNHTVTADNPYADPRSFYKVILSCNDALHNIEYMRDTNLISESVYNRDYSEIAGFRAWMYYLLAVHYGEVPYITEPIENVDMLDMSQYPMLGLEEVMDSLIVFVADLPRLGLVDWAVSIDGYSGINRAFVDKEFLLGDMLLWRGHYEEAATIYKYVMDRNDPSGRYTWKTSYVFGYNYEMGEPFTWNQMFLTDKDGLSSSTLYREWRWYCIVDNRFDQSTEFVRYFSNSYGDYLLKPSQRAINLWEEDTLINGEQGDRRGQGASWVYDGGVPVVQKYLYEVESPFDNDADLYVYRIGTMYLRYAEAVNRLGKPDLALAILNPDPWLSDDPRAKDRNIDLFNFDSTFLRVLVNLETHQEDFGVRGRVYLPPVEVDSTVQTLEDSIIFVEDLISKEYAREVAFEGDRWQNLLRIAHRRENLSPGWGTQFLSDAVAAKFEAKGDNATAQEVRNKLMDTENWYLPLE